MKERLWEHSKQILLLAEVARDKKENSDCFP